MADALARDLARRWRQGEHVIIVGPTGAGKTWLAAEILQARWRYIIAIISKPRDATLKRQFDYTWKKAKKYEDITWSAERVLLLPDARNLASASAARYVVADTLDQAYGAGGWTIFIDELQQLSESWKLDTIIRTLFVTARSNNITMCAACQRPRRIPAEALNQTTYVVMFHLHDEMDVARVAEATGTNKKTLININEQLHDHMCALIDTHNGIKIYER